MPKLLRLRGGRGIGKPALHSPALQRHRSSDSYRIRPETGSTLGLGYPYASQLTEKHIHTLLLCRGQSGEEKGILKVPEKKHSVSSSVSPARPSLRLLEQGRQVAPTAWASPTSTVLGVCCLPRTDLHSKYCAAAPTRKPGHLLHTWPHIHF